MHLFTKWGGRARKQKQQQEIENVVIKLSFVSSPVTSAIHSLFIPVCCVRLINVTNVEIENKKPSDRIRSVQETAKHAMNLAYISMTFNILMMLDGFGPLVFFFHMLFKYNWFVWWHTLNLPDDTMG